MNERSLRTLEFTKVRQRLTQYTFFSASQALASRLEPSADQEWVRERQAETTQAKMLLSLTPNASVGAARDITSLVTRAEKGTILEPIELLDIVATLTAGKNIRNAINQITREVPNLAKLASQITDCPAIEKSVVRCISNRGEVLDTASLSLRRIRQEMQTAHDRLLRRLEEYLESPQTRPLLQEPIITMRDGRYVIPVKSESRNGVPGIVHDQSGSGATVFIEPMLTVEQNNRWRQLQLEERDEVEKILLDLSSEVAEYAGWLRGNVTALASLDLALAKARYSIGTHSVEPVLLDAGSSSRIDLRKARHPLLIGDVVPIDLNISGDTSIVIITGPNTGGKTVALKTAGLLALMAQAGLHIPAGDGSALRVFDEVFADIGDEQSLEQSLSTFSSHLVNIIELINVVDNRSLVILDEIGAGTDPTEGSSLARAILNRLIAIGTTSIVATHYPELKAYAHNTKGVQNASVEFDQDTLAPTYKLSIGLPGRSNALAIASRLGLDPAIIADATTMVSPDHMQVEALLGRIQDEYEAARATTLAIEQSKEEVENLKQQLETELHNIEEERERVWEEARDLAETELQEVRDRLRAILAGTKGTAREAVTKAAAEVRAFPKVIDTHLPKPKSRQRRRELRAGGMVAIRSLQQTGRLLAEMGDGDVEVQIGGFRVRVPIRELECADQQDRVMPVYHRAASFERQVPDEIEVRGWTVEQVLPVLDQYLNDAYLASMPQVRIVHGKGTGTLRRVVREQLSASPMVDSFYTADVKAGGEGVTVAVLSNHG
jgi:DNA mismatch repair protein MutS2